MAKKPKKRKSIKKTDVVTKVLDSADGIVEVGMTVEDVIYRAGQHLDHGGIEGIAIFKLKGHKGWFVGTEEFCIELANPAFVKDRKQQKEDEEGE